MAFLPTQSSEASILSLAHGRDSGATPGKDVAYVKGGCISGGSTKNWTSEVMPGSVLFLYHVNKIIFEKELSSLPKEITAEVVEVQSKPKDIISKEKERVLAYLKVLEKEEQRLG